MLCYTIIETDIWLFVVLDISQVFLLIFGLFQDVIPLFHRVHYNYMHTENMKIRWWRHLVTFGDF